MGYHSSRKYQRSRFGDGLGGALVVLVLGDPDAAAFAAGGLGHEAELVFAGDGGGVDLDELAVGVVGALLVEGGLGGAGADDGVGGLAEDGSVAAGADDDGVGGEGAGLHGAEVHGGRCRGRRLWCRGRRRGTPSLRTW